MNKSIISTLCFFLCITASAKGPIGKVNGAILYDRSQRNHPKELPFEDWKPADPTWKEVGVEWRENKPVFPEGTIIVQSDNRQGGSNRFWSVYGSDGNILASINKKETTYQCYSIVHFYNGSQSGERFELEKDEVLPETFLSSYVSSATNETEEKSNSAKNQKITVRIVNGVYSGSELEVQSSAKEKFGIENVWDLNFNDDRHRIPPVHEFSLAIFGDLRNSGFGFYGKIAGTDQMKIISSSWIHEEDLVKLQDRFGSQY